MTVEMTDPGTFGYSLVVTNDYFRPWLVIDYWLPITDYFDY